MLGVAPEASFGPGQPFHFSLLCFHVFGSARCFLCVCDLQATEVIAKIRDWEKAARVGEHFALKVSGAVIGRAELMRDALELLMVGIERQRIRLETLATVRKRRQRYNTPTAISSSGLELPPVL